MGDMERMNMMFVLECCVLRMDGATKEKMISYGASPEIVEIGIELCNYLKNKEIKIEVINGS